MDYEMYERNLPPYLVHDRDDFKMVVEEKSRLHDFIWSVLLGIVVSNEVIFG